MCNNFLDFTTCALNDRIKCNDYLINANDGADDRRSIPIGKPSVLRGAADV